MAVQSDPIFGINFGWDLASDGWKAGMDFNLQVIANMLNPLVVSKAVASPPGAPLVHSKYIVPSSGATGEWSSKANQIAIRFDGKWNYITPVKGMRFMLDDTNTWTEFNGTAWT